MLQQKVREHFKNAHYVHCYAHQLNLIMQQATFRIKKVNVFFSDPSGGDHPGHRNGAVFWTRLFHEDCPELHLQGGILTAVIINTVYKNRDDLLECFEAIKTGSHGQFDQLSVREASGYVRMLQDKDFIYIYICFFHNIMPHVEILYHKLQKKGH